MSLCAQDRKGYRTHSSNLPSAALLNFSNSLIYCILNDRISKSLQSAQGRYVKLYIAKPYV